MPSEPGPLRCCRCGRSPEQIPEIVAEAKEEEMSPDEWVRENEGTLNTETGRFACDKCYIALGMPANPWPLPAWTP